MKFTDIQLLILTRAIGNLSDKSLRALINDINGEARIQDSVVDAYGIYSILKEELDENNIDYATGTYIKPKKLKGVQ